MLETKTMPDEIYDVIDEHDNKIGTATWTECHTRGLRHQGVSVLIFKDASRNEMLLQQRSNEMHQFPGKWQHAAGGHVLSGETLEHAIRKEIQEELFDGKPLPPFEIKKITKFFNHDMPGNYETLHLYEAIYPGPFFPNAEEVAELKWVSWRDVKSDFVLHPNQYAPYFISVVNEYEAAIQRDA